MSEQFQSNNDIEISLYGKKKKEKKINYQKYSIISLLIIIGFISLSLFLKKCNLNTIFYASIKNSERRCVILGYGAVARSTLPLIVKKFKFKEYILIDKRQISKEELLEYQDYKVSVIQHGFYVKTVKHELQKYIKDKDVVINHYGVFETIEILKALTTKKDIIYIDASLEEEDGHLYALYEKYNNFLKDNKYKITGVIDAGANPGLITHFSKMGIIGMAKSAIKRGVKDSLEIKKLLDKKDFKKLAQQLQVNTIHISEHDSIEPSNPSEFENYIVNTWCLDSFIKEWLLPCEFAAGTHDLTYFKNHNFTFYNAIMPAVESQEFQYIKTASPYGIFTGKTVIHPETVDIANVFNNHEHNLTVVFIYKPTKLSRKGFEKKNCQKLPHKIIDETTGGQLKGNETMGATLISARDDIPIRWYGSILTSEESRRLGCKLNPTVLQVSAGIISHLDILLQNPKMGMGNPRDFDSDKIMEIAGPLLGIIYDDDLPFNLSDKWENLLSSKKSLNNDF